MNTKQLRQKILDLAIRGKLVPQNPNDEPASVLLERVRAEKARLTKEGKIKRDKKDSVVLRGDDKLYYEQLPQGWEFIQLGDVIELFSGQDLTPDRYNDMGIGIPYITGASCLENNRVLINRWTDSPQVHSCNGDLLLTVKGAGVGKMAISHLADAHIARQIMAIRAYCGIDNRFIGFVLSAELSTLTSQANGLIPGIRREIVLTHEIALPPLAEQRRIVAAIESSFTVIDEIERNKTDLQAAVAAAKSKILSLAIRGKLVPQDPEDEPIETIFGNSKAEKEPMLFDIPDNWKWYQLEEIGTTNIGLAYKPKDICDNGVPVIRSNNIKNGKLDFSDLVRVNTPLTDSLELNDDDIVICARNGSKHLVGKCAVVQNKTERLTFGAFMAVYRSECNQYIYHFLNSNFFRQIFESEGISTQINQLTQAMIKETIIPLPPIEEQRRIVAAVEVAFGELDNIMSTLN